MLTINSRKFQPIIGSIFFNCYSCPFNHSKCIHHHNVRCNEPLVELGCTTFVFFDNLMTYWNLNHKT